MRNNHNQQLEKKMNQSKVEDPRFWKRWVASGAVAQEVFPQNALSIEAIVENYAGPAKGYQTLSLGRQIVSSNSSGTVWKPLYTVAVPMGSSYNYKLGQVLPRIPRNAIPVNILFQR